MIFLFFFLLGNGSTKQKFRERDGKLEAKNATVRRTGTAFPKKLSRLLQIPAIDVCPKDLNSGG